MTIRTVTHKWDDAHGDCYDCGDPAAFVVAEFYWNQELNPDSPPPVTEHNKMCSVCAANHAAEGFRIYSLWPEENFPIQNQEHEKLLSELGIDFQKEVVK